VLRYGYMMVQTTSEVTLSTVITDVHGSRYPSTCTYRTVVKQRRRATPFGFGVDFGKLSPKQLSIIAALGLNKGGR
jgi:hypothetical protein